MLTDSNEDSLLARIERRRGGEKRRGGYGPPLSLSRPYQSFHTHTHVHAEI